MSYSSVIFLTDFFDDFSLPFLLCGFPVTGVLTLPYRYSNVLTFSLSLFFYFLGVFLNIIFQTLLHFKFTYGFLIPPFFIFDFQVILNLPKSCKNFTKFTYTFHSAFPNVNNLYNHSTIIKTGN